MQRTGGGIAIARPSRSLVGVLGLAIALTLPSVAAADNGDFPPPNDWHGRPPIHAQGHAIAAPIGYTPVQIRHAYGIDLLPGDGSGQVIGIVDAYDDPTVASDLQTFITTFGLSHMNGLPGTPTCTVATGPHPCFQKVAAQNPPSPNPNWLLETTIDVQWAHAIALGADILLVEAKDDSFPHLFKAIDVAARGGASVVSMSWGGPEFEHETHDDRHFRQRGVTFVAASGDGGTGILYPAASPYVVAVGGTTLHLDSAGVRTADEIAWSGSGGGISAYESEPGYQSAYPIPTTGGKRGVPDVAYDADPSTGVATYLSFQGQGYWTQTGGTSIGAPQWAGLIALADQARTSTSGALSSADTVNPLLYGAGASAVYASTYRDITTGDNGPCGSICTALPGYDFITGLGSPRAEALVPYLSTH